MWMLMCHWYEVRSAHTHTHAHTLGPFSVGSGGQSGRIRYRSEEHPWMDSRNTIQVFNKGQMKLTAAFLIKGE